MPCASAIASDPSDILQAFHDELVSRPILHFVSDIETAPESKQRIAFDHAVTAASTSGEQDVASARDRSCPDRDTRIGVARALVFVEQVWRPRSFADDDTIAEFDRVLALAVDALSDATPLSPDQQRTALLPFRDISSDTDAPPSALPKSSQTSPHCMRPDTRAHIIAWSQVDFGLYAASPNANAPSVPHSVLPVRVVISLDEEGDVRSATPVGATAAAGSDDNYAQRLAILDAVTATYLPARHACRPTADTDDLTFHFDADFGVRATEE